MKIIMKKLLILIFLTSALSSSQAQLAGTIWRIYDTTNVPMMYYKFDNDSLGNSPNNGVYTNFSKYFVNGNEVRFLDAPDTNAGACSPTDTAIYSFAFKSDTLDFTYVHDSCYGRYLTIALYYWVKPAVGISEPMEKQDKVSIFPNPVQDRLFIEYSNEQFSPYEYSIIDYSGSLIKKGRIKDALFSIDVTDLPSGMYFFIINNDDGIRQKFMKE